MQLVSRAQVDIRDIFVSDITDQFLAYMQGLEPDMERAGEFLEMAARLLEIKSRRLLPGAQEDEELAEMGEELVRQLEEYRRYKWVSLELKRRESRGAAYYYRLPMEIVHGELEILNASPLNLFSVFQRLMANAEAQEERQEAEGEIERDNFTVQEQIIQIRHRLLTQGKCMFSSLFGARFSRQAVVTAFMAVLEMIKLGQVRVAQAALYDDIEIIPVG